MDDPKLMICRQSSKSPGSVIEVAFPVRNVVEMIFSRLTIVPVRYCGAAQGRMNRVVNYEKQNLATFLYLCTSRNGWHVVHDYNVNVALGNPR